MPRNGATNLYYYPPGTEGFPDQTVESEKYNNYIADVAYDLNLPRPIVTGGTGANNADDALSNLGGEKSSQLVTNYDTHVWYPGSFYSLPGATGAPPTPAGQTADRPFVGWVISSDPAATPPTNNNVVVRAHDQSGDATSTLPGRVYVREKKAGVWGLWSIDGLGIASDAPPLNPPDGMLWWDTETGTLYIYYRDVDSAAWVIASPQPDPELFLQKSGDTMTGMLTLAVPPVGDMDAVNKKYLVDAGAALKAEINGEFVPALDGKVDVVGDVMTGDLMMTRSAAPTTGAVKFGNSGNQMLAYNGSQFIFTSELYVNRKATPSEGLIFFGNSGNNYIHQTGGTFNFTGSVSVNNTIFATGAISSNAQVSGGSFYSGGSITTLGTAIHTNDLTVTRGQQGSPANGLIFLGNSGNRYIFHDTGALYYFSGAGINVAGESYKPGGGSWADASDARIKNVLGEYTQGLSAIKQITPKRYTFKGNHTDGKEIKDVKFPERRQGGPDPRSPHFTAAESKQEFVGLIAQDVEGVMPEMVKKATGEIDGEKVSDLRNLDTNALTYALINAVKELAARVEALEGK